MSAFETYIRDLQEIRATGAAVKETSYYGALEKLLNELGKTLKPKVRCVMQLKNIGGAGMPDGGLFTASQFQRKMGDTPANPTNPERGVIEIKGTGDDAWVVAETKQVSKYWNQYRQVLVTNYRDFVLIGQDANGQPATLETYRLAKNEAEFWQKAKDPKQFAHEQEEQFSEYLKRVMLQSASIATPKDLAWFLASYAKDAKARVEKTDLPALETLRKALEEALGITFTGDKKDPKKGERFFKSTLVQTLFYGIFSAWVLWHKQKERGRFDWRVAGYYLHVPMIKALFEKVATPTHVRKLDLEEVLNWAGEALNRVDRESFFSKFEEEQAVQYFYEPFLEAFDPELRKEMGVWYTPPEIVQYMVARVDTVLREELQIEDGLADPNVYILDPCCGTGTFLVEVLRRIEANLQDKGMGALVGSQLKAAAMNRVFGFEILTAPFVVAHLQLGLLLQNLGVPLSDEQERVGVYLTNALTGWKPPSEDGIQRLQQLAFTFPELKLEHDAADQVKQEKPILVVIGNPPYNAYAGISPEEERGLVEPYKVGLISEWGIKKFNLDELYVRFFRLAERCIAEGQQQKGVVCFISNHSWINEPSFVVLRKNLLNSFDRFYIENMHGNRKISEYAPDGRTSETIFSIPGFSTGIQQGVAISLWVKHETKQKETEIMFRDDVDNARAAERRSHLLNTLNETDFISHYQVSKPTKENRFSFLPAVVSEYYLDWIKIIDLCEIYPFNGPIERRGNSLIVYKSERASFELLSDYLDASITNNQIKAIEPRFMKSSGEFDAEKTRNKLKGNIQYDSSKISRYPFKPFDIRLAYLDPDIQPLFSRPSPELLRQRRIQDNAFFITRDTADKSPEGSPFYFSRLICDYDCISGHARHFPLQFIPLGNRNSNNATLFDIGEFQDTTPKANLSDTARAYLSELGITDPDQNIESAVLIWMHALAIGYSPAYLVENADGIRQDFPRIPLPNNRDLLIASATLGRQIAALLDPETPVAGVTSGKLRPELKTVAVVSRVGTGNLDPNTDFALKAGWGYAGQNGVTMPGKGRVSDRSYIPEEQIAITEVIEQLGPATHDIYLNDVAYWKNIPDRVWDYTIGGYQVIKKWLSYREQELLGRALKQEEVMEVTQMARRIATILLLEPELDANYESVKQSAYPWATQK
jgi:type I restriction-modification system DNA methylase subunit